MGTSYTDQLAKWVKEKKSTPRNKNLVAFLAVRADIKEAIDAGYPVKTVWQNMHELKRIDFGYDTFLNYVNRQIRRLPANHSTPQVEPDLTKTSHDIISKALEKHTESKTKKLGTLSGFIFNPVPNPEELF